MPVLTRRQQMLTHHQLNGVKLSIESDEAMNEPSWAVEDDYERPQKEMDFPLTPLGKVPSRKDSMSNLRIYTYPSSDLHERYMESEEEASPSPDSETESNDEELKHKAPATSATEIFEATTVEESAAEIATAVPIRAVGRPKLVDIITLAPMHKRKRTDKSPLSRSVVMNGATPVSVIISDKPPSLTQVAAKNPAAEGNPPKRMDSLAPPAPDSWLPEDIDILQEEGDHYFPDLELRNPPSYNDYDPYSLDPPRLSPHNSYNNGKKPGSVARARNNSNGPAVANSNGWKGLTRSLSIAKKQTLHRGDHQVTKKPKMVARAANEREEPLAIPAFPLDGRNLD